MNRIIRRFSRALERAERASGKWSPFVEVKQDEIARGLSLTRSTFQDDDVEGWVFQVHTVWRNGWMVVSVRTIERTALGVTIDHAFITTALGSELTWSEKQRIKHELFGPDRMAVEVYPRSDDLIDAVNMSHLWVFPVGYRFDFGLGEGQQ